MQIVIQTALVVSKSNHRDDIIIIYSHNSRTWQRAT